MGQHILIVDDEAVVRNVVNSRLLPHFDFRAEAASALFLLVLFAFAIWLALNPKSHRRLVVAILLSLSVANFGLYVKYKNAFIASRAETSAELKDLRALMTEIRKKTGWSYEHLREHLFMSGLGEETDLYWIYTDVARNDAREPSKKLVDVDGIVARYLRDNPVLADTSLPNPLRTVECRSTSQIGSFTVCYYSNPKLRPRWNNIGRDYLPLPREPRRTPGDAFAGRLMACDVPASRCEISFKATIHDGTLVVSVDGEPLSVSHPGALELAASALREVALEITCPNETATAALDDHLGLSDDRRRFLAPVDFAVDLPCARPEAITIVVGKLIVMKTDHFALESGPLRVPLAQLSTQTSP